MQGDFNVDWDDVLPPEDQLDDETSKLYKKPDSPRAPKSKRKKSHNDHASRDSKKSHNDHASRDSTYVFIDTEFETEKVPPKTGAPFVTSTLTNQENTVIFIPAAPKMILQYKSTLVDIFVMNFPNDNIFCRRAVFGYFLTPHMMTLFNQDEAIPLKKIAFDKMLHKPYIRMGTPGVPYTKSFHSQSWFDSNFNLGINIQSCLENDEWNSSEVWKEMLEEGIQYYAEDFKNSISIIFLCQSAGNKFHLG